MAMDMALSIACILLLVCFILWLVGQFLPNTGRLAQIALILWVAIATFVLCGFTLDAD